MKRLPLAALVAAAVIAAPVHSADDAATKSAASAPTQHDCAKTMRHDHGAEKGTPSPKSAKATGCGGTAASAPAKKSEKAHDGSTLHRHS